MPGRRGLIQQRAHLPAAGLGNIAPPGQAGAVAGSGEEGARSGSEHGTTLASSVVAIGAGPSG